MKSKIGWLAVRCLVALFFASSMSAEFNDTKNWPQDFPISGAVFIFIGTSIMIPISYAKQLRREMKRGKVQNWSTPSWFSNPFSGQPQFFHMAANAVIITGLVGLLQSALSGRVVSSNLFPLTCGWGIMTGSTLFYELIFDKINAESTGETSRTRSVSE